MKVDLDGCRHVENAFLINVLLTEGVNVFKSRRGCAVRAVCQLNHMTETRRLLNGEHHLCRQDISLLHLQDK